MRAMMATALVFWAGTAAAGDWQALDGAAITAALEGRSLNYGDASQNFEAGGLTAYFADEPSTGAWRVDGDQYCSQWPPSDSWSCYDIEATDSAVRFIGADGSVTEGTYME